MNERIKELAKESGLIQYDSDSKIQDVKKFAELIVRECVEQSLKVSHRNNDMGSIIANMIKQHFGVKE
jgi:hypothetical protein